MIEPIVLSVYVIGMCATFGALIDVVPLEYVSFLPGMVIFWPMTLAFLFGKAITKRLKS